MQVEYVDTGVLIPYARNTRTHSGAQIKQVADSISEFGFTNPVLIDGENGIIAGHGRVMAAQSLNLNQVPCIRLSHLTDDQKRAYVIVDNKLAHLKTQNPIKSQAEIAEHLDTSDRTIRELQDKLGFSCKTNTIDEIRVAYIRHLREQAAGRAGTGDLDLVAERAKLAKVQHERIEMQNAVTRREYGPIDALEFGLTDLLVRVASQLDTIPGKVKIASDKLTAADLDIVTGVIAIVRNDIASMEINWFDDKADADNKDDINVELDA